MCGIVGMFDRRGRQAASEQALRLMLSLLRHRGPDEFGILLDREAGLGNARLSILDLAGGSQPIANEDESLWIVFNGEIFNHLELRNELRNRGHQFRTASDTEVVLHLYEDFREDCLQQLNGQFAIAIWDSRRRRLFLARDRLGVRPVFYCELPDSTLLFASEVKAILSDPRVSAELGSKGNFRCIHLLGGPAATHSFPWYPRVARRAFLDGGCPDSSRSTILGLQFPPRRALDSPANGR